MCGYEVFSAAMELDSTSSSCNGTAEDRLASTRDGIAVDRTAKERRGVEWLRIVMLGQSKEGRGRAMAKRRMALNRNGAE